MATTFRRFGGDCTQPLLLPSSLTGDSLLRRLWWSQRNRMFAGMTAGVVWMGTSALVPVALGRAIDNGVGHHSLDSFICWVGAVAALYIIQAIAWPIRHRIALGLFERSLYWCDELVATRSLDPRGGLDAAYTPGETTSLITADNRRISNLMDVSCRGAGSIVTFIGVLTAMLVISWPLAVAILIGILPLLLVLLRFLRLLERRTYEQNQRLGDSSSIAADFIGALRVIKGVGGENVAIERYAAGTDDIVTAALASANIRSRALALDLVMPSVVMTVVGWFGAHLVSSGQLSIGQLVMFSGWSIFLIVPLLTFSEMGRKWAMGRAAARRLVAALTTPVAFNNKGTRTLTEPAGLLDIGGLIFEPGAFVSIIATPNKTVELLANMSRVKTDNNQQTPVSIDDIDVNDLTLDSLRSTLLIAEHDAVLFGGTLRDNLLAARHDATEAEMMEALTNAAALDIIESLDDGLDGIVAERGRSLSGGQRQRVALARAFLTRAPILVLVDPTSALDSFTEAEIVERIREARSGLTTLVFTSSAALWDISERVVNLNEDGNTIAITQEDAR